MVLPAGTDHHLLTSAVPKPPPLNWKCSGSIGFSRDKFANTKQLHDDCTAAILGNFDVCLTAALCRSSVCPEGVLLPSPVGLQVLGYVM